MKGNLLEANEVCALVGTSVYSLNSWYKFAQLHPESEYAKMLPPIVRLEGKRTRYWTRDSVGDLIKFKTSIPHGRGGVLGDVTQKYVRGTYKTKVKKEETETNGKTNTETDTK